MPLALFRFRNAFFQYGIGLIRLFLFLPIGILNSAAFPIAIPLKYTKPTVRFYPCAKTLA